MLVERRAAAVAAVAADHRRGWTHRAVRADTRAADDTWTLGSAMRHHAFWSLFCIFFFTGIGMFSISVQVVDLSGRGRLLAAAGRDRVGLFRRAADDRHADRELARRTARPPPRDPAGLRPHHLGILMLWSLSRYPNIWLLAGFLLCFGSTMGSRGPLVAAAAMSIFRGKRVGTIMGTISIGMGLGSAVGSWAGGLIHDWSQSYDLVFAFALCQRRARHDAVSGGAGAAAVTSTQPSSLPLTGLSAARLANVFVVLDHLPNIFSPLYVAAIELLDLLFDIADRRFFSTANPSMLNDLLVQFG